MNNLELATDIWHGKLNPMQRFEIMQMFDFKTISKRYNSCINYIANNLEKFN
jgi:hypothetical protein